MRLPPDMLFVPTWLALIMPRNPANRFAGDPVYPPSRLTARVVTSDMGPEASGEIAIPPTREELLAREAAVVGARRARKEARAGEMGSRWRRTDPNGYASRNAKAERRAAREARRIMVERRESAMAAFACSSPTWCDGTTNDCHHCPYGREE